MHQYRRPYKVKRKKSILKNRFFWLGILILIVFIAIFYFLILSPVFKIKEIKISGNQKVLTTDIENTVQKVLSSEGKNIFILNTEKIKNEISFNFPQIGQVKVKKELPDGLIIAIEERKPVAVFCHNVNYFLTDKEGIIFEQIPEAMNDYLKIQNPSLNKDLKLGDRAVEEEQMAQILAIESKLREDLKIPLIGVSIISEKRFNLETLEGWEVYLNPEGDLNWQLTKLKAVLEEEIPLEKRKDLEYIELRFGNFAPYKYR